MPLFDSFSNAASRGDGVNLIPATAAAGPSLYSFSPGTSFTFTSAGISGSAGPTLAQSVASYNQSTYPWVTNTSYLAQGGYGASLFQGYQKWTVPATGQYQFTCAGAGGGQGTNTSAVGSGLIIQATFNLVMGEFLTILVGQTPIYYGIQNGGGGGGTFVMRNTTQSGLIVAGGGAASQVNGSTGPYANGRPTPTDTYTGSLGQGGVMAPGGSSFYCGGGGGFYGSGQTGTSSSALGGNSFTSNGIGGTSSYQGGFGGGGSATQPDWPGGAPGGGYSGGDVDSGSSGTSAWKSSGGGSYIDSTGFSTNTAFGFRSVFQSGYVLVTRLS